jgi:voltage-gated potassium channel
MPVLLTLWRFYNRNRHWFSWKTILAYFVTLFLASWGLFWVVEPANPLVLPKNYFWYFEVTATTIGYGDFYPATFWGHVIGALVIPGAIVGFTSAITAVVRAVHLIREQFMNGSGRHTVTNHVVIIGHCPQRLHRLVKNIEHGQIVIVVPDDSDIATDPFVGTPFHDRVGFVRGSLLDAGTWQRANVGAARAIVLDLEQPGEAYAIADELRDITPAHIVVGLADQHKAWRHRITGRLKGVECITQAMPTLMAKEAEVPGSGRVIASLMNDGDGADFHALEVPNTFPGANYDGLFVWFSRFYAATLLAAQVEDVVNESPEGIQIMAGDTLFYKTCGQPLEPSVLDGYKAPVVTFA